MKNLLTTLIVFLITVNVSIAQSIYVSEDSMNNAANPGKYFLDQLQPYTIFDEGDTVEGDVKHAITRDFGFWLDRMPGGINIDSPFYKYNYLMRNYKTSSCTPKIGDFNGNWENTGPKTASQSQGRVYDVYVKPVPYPATPSEMWIGTGNAGLWKTVNGGTNWTCVSDGWNPSINGAGVSAIAVNPFNPDKMYVSTKMDGNEERRNYMAWEYGQGIWYSSNGGNTWTIDLAGLGSFDYMDFIEYCPFQLNGGTDEMIIGTRYNRVYQKIGAGAWVDVTPATLLATPLMIRDITFGPNGKFYLSTQHNYLETPPNVWTYFGPKVIEFNYTSTGLLTSSTIINDNNNTNQFVFSGATNANAIAFETGYAGGNNLYVMVVAYPSGTATEGHHTLYNYNISTGALTVEYAIPNCNTQCKSMWRTSVTVSPNNPNVIYVEGVRPYRLTKGVNGWSVYEYPNNGGAFHDDGLVSRIYHTDPLGNINNDIVYWGNDGGLTRTIGTTTQTNLNGDLITNEVYDVDVAELGKKRAVTTYDNGLHTRTGSNGWEYDINHRGDGFTAIYDSRFDKIDVPLLFHRNSNWDWYTHGSALMYGGVFDEYPRRMNTPGSIDLPRAFEFPHSFDNGFMYGGNKNLLRSANMGYGTVWYRETMGGDLNGAGNTITDNCRAFAVSKDIGNGAIGQRMYYGMRRPPADALGKYHVFYARRSNGNWYDWTPVAIKNGYYNLTDIVIDDKKPTRVFISMGMIDGGASTGAPVNNRVLQGDYDPVTNNLVWTDMSNGLSELPVTCLVYQEGSDDIIYAGTDAGVYRWDKPLGCWVKFNDGIIPGEKMPSVIVHDMVIDYCSGKLVMGSYGRGVWETDLYQPNTAPGYTEVIDDINPVVWGSQAAGVITNKYIKGSILVKSGSTLIIQGQSYSGPPPLTYVTTIYMPKYGRIDVEKGAKLKIDGVRITNDCGTNWYGIFAHGDGQIKQIQSSIGLDPAHGIVEIGKSKLEYAEEALNNGGGSSNPNTGGILRISGVEFYNNRRSAAFYQFHNWAVVPGPNPGTSIQVQKEDVSFIDYSTFTVDNNIRTGFFADITMWGVRGVRLKDNVFVNNQNLNQSHQRAVYTIDASYKLYTSIGNGFKSRIEGFYTGIESTGFSWNQGNLFPILVEDNIFDKNEIGINFNTIVFPVIRKNRINIGMKQTPYPAGGAWSYYSLGSKLVNTNDFAYNWNYHERLYPTPINTVFQYTAGTEVYNTGKGNIEIESNDYKSLLIGNDCGGTCGDNNTTGLNYTCNRNQMNTKYDFILQANAIVKKTQSRNFYSAGNEFTQSPSVTHWYHAPGGNSPVTYLHRNVAIEIPTNYTFGNVTLINTLSGGCPTSPPSISPSNSNNEEFLTVDYLNETQLNDMKAEFYTNEVDYTNYKTLYQLMIDSGNTDGVLIDIDGNDISEQMQTRQKMLSMSPYLSQEVLQELALSGTVSNPILFEIIMANPDASQSEEFINLLSYELPTPFPAYMITLIKQSWEGATARTLLENNMNTTYSSMTDLKNKILRGYMLSDTLRNEDTIYTWLSKVNNLRNAYQLIEYQLYKGNFSQSQAMLTDLPAQYRMNETDMNEYSAYTNLYNFKKSLLQDTLEINQLDSARIASLKEIADATDVTFPRDMARNALCFFYQICYPDTVRELPVIANNKIQPLKQAEEDKAVTAYPNPAKEYVIFYYNLPTGVAAKTLLVTDVTGKRVYSADLTNKQGQHTWDVRSINEGNYIYTITNSLGEKYTGKVTIKK